MDKLQDLYTHTLQYSVVQARHSKAILQQQHHHSVSCSQMEPGSPLKCLQLFIIENLWEATCHSAPQQLRPWYVRSPTHTDHWPAAIKPTHIAVYTSSGAVTIHELSNCNMTRLVRWLWRFGWDAGSAGTQGSQIWSNLVLDNWHLCTTTYHIKLLCDSCKKQITKTTSGLENVDRVAIYFDWGYMVYYYWHFIGNYK